MALSIWAPSKAWFKTVSAKAGDKHVRPSNTPSGDGAASEVGAQGSKPVLLMADADRLTVWSLRHYLGGSYAVVHAGGTGEALDFLRQGRADAVVISDNLPGGELDRLVELALQQVGPGKVIKLQSLVEEPRGEAASPTIVLEKPFDLGQLKGLLEDMRPAGPGGSADPPSAEGAP